MLSNSGPAPVTFEFEGETIVVPPNIMSSDGCAAIRRELRKELLQEVEFYLAGEPSRNKLEMAYRIRDGVIPLAKVESLFENEKYLPFAMSDVMGITLEKAQAIVKSFNKFSTLADMIWNASALGNSIPPRHQGGSNSQTENSTEPSSKEE